MVAKKVVWMAAMRVELWVAWKVASKAASMVAWKVAMKVDKKDAILA